MAILVRVRAAPKGDLVLTCKGAGMLMCVSTASYVVSVVVGTLLYGRCKMNSTMVNCFVCIVVMVNSCCMTCCRGVLGLGQRGVFVTFVGPALFSLVTFKMACLLPCRMVRVSGVDGGVACLFVFALGNVV